MAHIMTGDKHHIMTVEITMPSLEFSGGYKRERWMRLSIFVKTAIHHSIATLRNFRESSRHKEKVSAEQL